MTRRCAQAGPHNWLIFRLIEPALAERLGRYARGRLADVGCGAKPWQELARGRVDRHVGFDRGAAHGRAGLDVESDACALPVEDESFDTLLCTYLLEHLEEPGDAVAEAFRVLRPGGYAIYTVPLHWHLHEEPRDFFRFTTHGLRHLFEKNGFDVVEIHPLTGFAASFGQAFAYYLYGLRRVGRRNPLWWLVPPLAHAVQALALWLHRFDRSTRFTAEYVAVVRKPPREAGDP